MDLVDNPFTPGMGVPPPVRAGHQKIADALDLALRRVLAGKPGEAVVMYGPRGNGKTTLLNELKLKAKAGNATIRSRTPSNLNGPVEEIARIMAHDDGTKIEVTAGIEANLGIVKGGINVAPSQSHMLGAVLQDLAGANPTVLLLDEAHVLQAELGHVLLNAVQDCIAGRLPLFVLLAGTPGLESNLRKMSSSFWERCEQLRVGRLGSADDIRAALAIPAKDSGLPFDDDALDLLVGESQGYPYFIQVLGKATWMVAAKAGRDRIGLADAQAGLAEADVTRNAFYQRRRNEAVENHVLAAAESVSREIIRKGPVAELTDGELEDALGRVVGPDAQAIQAARVSLSNLGLIWQTPRDTWEPGIPSLCAYLDSRIRS